MDQLIKALQILLKYGNLPYPTACCHNELIVVDIDPKLISKEDVVLLDKLGFIVQIDGDYDKENECRIYENKIYSLRYGSA